MAKGSAPKSVYVCTECGASHPKWAGKCPACNAWNSLVEQVERPVSAAARFDSWAGVSQAAPRLLSESKSDDAPRIPTGFSEVDRVLGGGAVPGGVVLLAGDPGIGKSTLLLQLCEKFAQVGLGVLYATGEESVSQVALRADRLGCLDAAIQAIAETDVHGILGHAKALAPRILIVDSIQTLYSAELQSAPGSVAQVRECAAFLTRYAKSTGTLLVLVGHVTKEGTVAGPRVLEHMVDTVLSFEGESDGDLRVLRAQKNRFGSTAEIGVFRMGESGLQEVTNTSDLFLTVHETPVSGSCVFAAMEGNRPLLIELQALVENTKASNPRRFSQGVDVGRLQMLIAVLNKHAGMDASELNVYLKVVGGLKLQEPGSDLAAALAVYSSMMNRPLPDSLVAFGEVGLAGELRAVGHADRRIQEAVRLNYKLILVPKGCVLKTTASLSRVRQVSNISDAILAVFGPARKGVAA